MSEFIHEILLFAGKLILFVTHSIFCLFSSVSTNGDTKLKNVSFFDGSTIIYCLSTCGDLILTDVIIDSAYSTGLYVNHGHGSLFLTNVTIANGRQEGLYVYGCNSNTFLDNVTISNNRGGGMILFYVQLVFLDHPSTIINNYSPTNGGGLTIGFQVLAIDGNTEVVINCSNNPTLQYFLKPLPLYVTSEALGVCLCSDDEGTINYHVRIDSHQLYPGQFITLPLVTVGVCGGISPAVLVTNSEGGIIVSLETINQETKKQCKNFTYQIRQRWPNISNGKIKLGIEEKLELPDNSSLIVDVTLLPCPNGLALSNGLCECNSAISSVSSVRCDVNQMPHPISKSSNSWLYYNTQYDCTVGYVNCPFDYCTSSAISFSLDDPDIQCANNRSGILCGACQQGLSLMLGSNKCGQCSNKNSLMLSVIECEGRKSYVWSVDGNIPYLGHKHIYLFILSLVVMLTGLLYTITIFSSQWMQRLSGRYCRSSWDPFYRFKPFLDAYTGPYKDKYRYWTGLLLIIRLLLTTVFSYTTGTIPIINTYITVLIAGLLIHLLSKEVYRNKILNILELLYMVNLCITALSIALINQFGWNIGTTSITVITALSVSLSMTTFLITTVVHLYIEMKKRCHSIQCHETREEPLLVNASDSSCIRNDNNLPSLVYKI
uniref:Right handed beta helix domain-containing protein n=1 Tax=Amphimedon queenslandica TaxID=400682 RepID=A0A1X7TPZ6_AMPQE